VTTQLAPVLGSGPAFFTAGAYNPTDRSTMKTLPPDQGIAAGTGWSIGKAPLVVPKTFHQPLVLRGGRIDGSGELGFSAFGPQRPFAALQFPPGADDFHVGKYKALGIGVWAKTSGCYALQVDSTRFSQIIVFRVEVPAA
jgi:hypothetical protein